MNSSIPSELNLTGESLVSLVLSYLAERKEDEAERLRTALEREIAEAGPSALADLAQRIATTGKDWTYYPPVHLVRRIHYAIADCMLSPGSDLLGREHLDAVGPGPVLLFANHLSYSDANLIEILLHRAGANRFADHLAVVAGPKVYSKLMRRFSSLCFGTIRTPQSSALSSEDAVMSPREVAIAAKRSITAAQDRLRAGDTLLVFVEGTRSRTAEMHRALPAVARYFESLDAQIIPVAITGSERMFPIGEDRLHPCRVTVTLGAPRRAKEIKERADGNRRVMMDALGLAIADMLPAEYRGEYAEHSADLDAARAIS